MLFSREFTNLPHQIEDQFRIRGGPVVKKFSRRNPKVVANLIECSYGRKGFAGTDRLDVTFAVAKVFA